MKPKQWYLFHWKYSQNQQKYCACLTIKHPCSIQLKEYLVYGTQSASKAGSHCLHYCEVISFHLCQLMTKFTFEQCLQIWLLFKLARNRGESFPVHLTKLSSSTEPQVPRAQTWGTQPHGSPKGSGSTCYAVSCLDTWTMELTGVWTWIW